MPPQNKITTEFVGPEVRKDGYQRLILPWILTCPGWLSGESTSTESQRPGFKSQSRIEFFSFILQLANIRPVQNFSLSVLQLVNRVCECMPPQDVITTEFVMPEVRKDDCQILILSWVHTYPGWLSGESTSTESQRPGFKSWSRIEFFSFNFLLMLLSFIATSSSIYL